MQRSVRDVPALHNFHVLLEEACEPPASGHFDGPSPGFQGDRREVSETRLSQ